MRSMTGFGSASVEENGRTVAIECKSVNNRFLDIAYRMPRSLGFLENVFKQAIGEKLARGHVDVFLKYTDAREDSKTITVDEALLSAYKKAYAAIAGDTGRFFTPPRPEYWLSLPGVYTVNEAPDDEEAITALALAALGEALDKLADMREKEGANIGADILSRVGTLREQLSGIEARAPMLPAEYKEKLIVRLAELMPDGVAVDENRIASEVALFADRCNIDEEIVRLKSHFNEFEAAAKESPCGRKLDFLLQEMNRETNTIGSKAQDSELLKSVVILKSELEKIREQVQNIE